MWSVGTLEWPDYVILAVFLVVSLGIGVYQALSGGRQHTTSEFIMADRRLRVVPTAVSLFVSFQSAVMILGLTAEMYQYGMQHVVWAPVGFFITMIVSERLVVPWIYPLQLVSINDVSIHVRALIYSWHEDLPLECRITVTVSVRLSRTMHGPANWKTNRSRKPKIYVSHVTYCLVFEVKRQGQKINVCCAVGPIHRLTVK